MQCTLFQMLIHGKINGKKYKRSDVHNQNVENAAQPSIRVM